MPGIPLEWSSRLNVERIGCRKCSGRFLSPSPPVGDGGTENLRNIRREIGIYMVVSGGWLHAVAVRASYRALKGFKALATDVSSAVPM
jgi:hypothetical protein